MADQTLSDKIRSQYPGAYDDLTDIELETKWLVKHPEDSKLPRAQQKEPATRPLTGDPTKPFAGVRAFGQGALQGLKEQIQHPFTWGGPQTEKLIEQNVPGGNLVTGTLNTLASPGSMAIQGIGGLGVRGARAVAPKIGPAAAKAVELATSPGAAGAATGAALGYHEAGVPGAIAGGITGYKVGPALGGKLGKVNKLLDRLTGGAEASEAGSAEKVVADKVAAPKPQPSSNVDPTKPLDATALAKEQGTRSAAGLPRRQVSEVPMGGVKPEGSMSREDFTSLREETRKFLGQLPGPQRAAANKMLDEQLEEMVNSMQVTGASGPRTPFESLGPGEAGKISPEAAVGTGIAGAGAAYMAKKIYDQIQQRLSAANKQVNPLQIYSEKVGK